MPSLAIFTLVMMALAGAPAAAPKANIDPRYVAARDFISRDSETWMMNRYDGNLKPLQATGAAHEGRPVLRGAYTYNQGVEGYLDLTFERARVQCYNYHDRDAWACPAPAPTETAARAVPGPAAAAAKPSKRDADANYAIAKDFLADNSRTWVMNRYDGNLKPLAPTGASYGASPVFRGSYTFNQGEAGYVDLTFAKGRLECFSFHDRGSWECPGLSVAAARDRVEPENADLIARVRRLSHCFDFDQTVTTTTTTWRDQGQRRSMSDDRKNIVLTNICSTTVKLESTCNVFGRDFVDTKVLQPGDRDSIMSYCRYRLVN